MADLTTLEALELYAREAPDSAVAAWWAAQSEFTKGQWADYVDGRKPRPDGRTTVSRWLGSLRTAADAVRAMSAREERLRRSDSPWSLREILVTLADFADERLGPGNYDGHGWEVVDQARKAAREAVAALDTEARALLDREGR